jgi:hypothetical protein
MRRETFTSAVPVTPKLYGDLELVIDEAFGGDADLKRRVALADAKDRSGLEVIKNAVKNRKVKLDQGLQYVLDTLEKDMSYFLELQSDRSHIEQRGESFRVKIQIEENTFRSSFRSLMEAQAWRDRMMLLKQDIMAQDKM